MGRCAVFLLVFLVSSDAIPQLPSVPSHPDPSDFSVMLSTLRDLSQKYKGWGWEEVLSLLETDATTQQAIFQSHGMGELARNFISNARSPQLVGKVMDLTAKWTQKLSPEINQVKDCISRNITLSGCSDAQTQLLNLFSNGANEVEKEMGIAASAPRDTPVGSRPSAPRFESAHAGTGLNQGEGYDTLAKKALFWLAVAFLYASHTYRTYKATAAYSGVPTSYIDRWKVIFEITPTFEEWFQTLSTHDDITLIYHDLCGQDTYPDVYVPLHSGTKDEWTSKMLDHQAIWSSAHKLPHQEVDLPGVLTSATAAEAALRECWDKAKVVAIGIPKTSFYHNAPQLVAGFLALSLLMTPRQIGLNDCPPLADAATIAHSLGQRYDCTNQNHFGSVCVATCLAGYVLDWSTSDSAGQITICGDNGLWAGTPLRCKPRPEYSYR